MPTDTSDLRDLRDAEPVRVAPAGGRSRALLVGVVAAVLALAAAVVAGLLASRVVDDGDVALPEPEAEIRFLPEDDESGQPLVGEDRTGDPAPDNPFPLLDGGLASLADFQGKPVVVNFFASWCVPCEAEMPDFAEVHAELGDEVTFLGISFTDREQDTRALLERTGVTYAIGRDPSGALAEDFGVVNMPTTYFLDAEGRIVSAHAGALTADGLRSQLGRAHELMLGAVDVPFAYAFTLGMVATVNPCGFPMLPAYLSFFLGSDDATEDRAGSRIPRALLAAAAVSLGFLAVFTVLSFPLNAGVTTIYRVMPWLTIVVGAALVGVGIAMLLGYTPRLSLPRLDRGGRDRRFGSMVLFGVSYAIASLSCTIPLFLSVVANRPGPAASALTVVAYGLGMSAVLTALTLAIALARESMVRRVRRLLPHVQRVSGALLVAVGLYLIYYWVFNLARDPSDTIGDNPFDGLERARVSVSALLERQGGGFGVAVAALSAVALATVVVRRRRTRAGAATSTAAGDDELVRR